MIFHTAAASLALASGAIVMLMPKGTPRHLLLGRVFAIAMMVVALTSFGITSVTPGRFSAIHILSAVTIVGVPVAIWQRRRGNIKAHARGMIVSYVALLLAGAFTLFPPRLLGQVFFGG